MTRAARLLFPIALMLAAGCQSLGPLGGLGLLKIFETASNKVPALADKPPPASKPDPTTDAAAAVEKAAHDLKAAADANQKTVSDTQRIAAEVTTTLGKAGDLIARVEDTVPHISQAIESAQQGDYTRTLIEIAAALGLGGGGLKLGQKLERRKNGNGNKAAA